MERIAFAGMGTMGAAMAGNLRKAGFEVTVWNRTPGRAGDVLALGATEAATPAQAAREATVALVCVSDTPDVEAVLFGSDGLASGLAAGSLVIDCSTIAPGATAAFAARLREQGIGFVDAPVSGGSEGARKATLTIFVGGDEADVERARPVLAAMGTTITHFGPAGAGQAVKAVNQVVIAGVYLAVAEGMVLSMKAGLDPTAVVSALGGGVAGSWILANRSAKMINNDYPLGFRTSLHLKDLGIALELGRETGTALPIAGLAAQFEAGLVARGYGDEDMSNLARVIRSLSGMEG
ncbi:MAG: NAD(P)-dependent oxidoreductase [Chloroflexota bacterium]